MQESNLITIKQLPIIEQTLEGISKSIDLEIKKAKELAKMKVDEAKCVGCKKCISELGCPAITFNASEKKALIEKSLCTGCTLCSQVCPVNAIVSEGGGK